MTAPMPATMPATAFSALVRSARRASAFAGDTGAARRQEAAQQAVRLPEPSVIEHGAARHAIFRAIRANVVALALTADSSARRSIAYSTRELCNALLSEPVPPPARVWWADHA